jgi:hypothetical protein
MTEPETYLDRPRCDNCHMLMERNGKIGTKKGIVYRFRCHYCGASKGLKVLLDE